MFGSSPPVPDESIYWPDSNRANKKDKQKRVAMISDFFYPNVGGVEMHLYQLSTCLIKRGIKVVLITHSYGNRKGIRYLSNGLKVYYLPQNQIYNQSSLPTTFFSTYLPLLRKILIREDIQIVHCHQAFSTMALEGLFHARTMGYKTCFTDHSLFGFADASSIHTNKILKFSLSDIDHVICVSHTSKENTVLRAYLDPKDVSVIPNAIDSTVFVPRPQSEINFDKIKILIMSRLVYRKGVDLMIEVIPTICRLYSNVYFVIGGSGPMKIDLEEMIETHRLHRRVEMLGSVSHSDVNSILASGDIFLNCSLTEAFCISIVEAASWYENLSEYSIFNTLYEVSWSDFECGLLCVSTRVGGIPEVLPSYMTKLAEPNEEDLVEKIGLAIAELPNFDRWKAHYDIKKMYSWFDIAERTEIVYDRMLNRENPTFIQRLNRLYNCGLWAGKIFCMVAVVGCLVSIFLEWWSPRSSIQLAKDFSYSKYQRQINEDFFSKTQFLKRDQKQTLDESSRTPKK